MTHDIEPFEVQVKSVTREADGINSFVLVALPGQQLPAFTAGAHVDVHLPGGLHRSYSLVNDPSERHRYVLGVARDLASRGGSRYMHETLRVGDFLRIGPPRNNFPLNEEAPHSVLIAGGIGITPLMSMARRLQSLGRPWSMHFCARSAVNAAFASELQALAGESSAAVSLHFDDEMGGARPDIAAMVASAPKGGHLYCCGPQPMLEAFERATAALPRECVHLESFTAREEADTSGGFTVRLARSGKLLEVAAGKSILDVLLDAGVDVQYGCMQGVCGSCETTVLQGVPDHRDSILDAGARASNRTMMVCCSGSKTPELALDL